MKKNTASWLLYYFAVAVSCVVMLASGKNGYDWEYWAMQGCMIMAHLAGCTQGD